MKWLWLATLAAFGLIFGSFANVVIWRVPRSESVVSPGSHCPRCARPVRFYDNVPVVSWLVLRGRCRDCGEPIHVRYPLVEAAAGALFALAGWRWGLTLSAMVAAAFFWCLLVLSVIDLDTKRLPNTIVAITAAIGAVGAIAMQATALVAAPLVGLSTTGWMSQPVVVAVVGSVAGAAVSGSIAWLYGRARGRRGLGMGDVKLLAAMGPFLGLYVLMAYAFANVIGVVGGIVVARAAGESLSETRVPFGPYLALAALITAVWGPALWAWYLRLAGLG